MKSTIAIALLIAGLWGSAAQAKLPTVCEGKGKCTPIKQTEAENKKQLDELQRDIRWARGSAQVLERATSTHVLLPMADKPVDEFTARQQLASMQTALKAAEKIVCMRKCAKYANTNIIQRSIKKRWCDVDYMFAQAEYKLQNMQMFVSSIIPSKHAETEEEFNFDLDAYATSAAQFQGLMEEIKVQVAIIEALGQLNTGCNK